MAEFRDLQQFIGGEGTDAAAQALPAWSQTPPAERRRVLLKAADLLNSRQGGASWVTVSAPHAFPF